MSRRFTGARRRVTLSVGGRWLVLVMGLALIVLVGCGRGFRCRGCVENSVPGHLDYRYQSLNGTITRRVNAKAGVILTVDYQATVETGTLAMRVLDPDGKVVWEQTFAEGEDVASSVDVDLAQQGRYELVVEAQQTRGAFELDWHVS
jgi:hypothetical protein